MSQPAPAVTEPVTAIARRILVVDDNRDSTESLTMLLQLTGHQMHAAYDGLEAIEAAATFRPDVILLDILACRNLTATTRAAASAGCRGVKA